MTASALCRWHRAWISGTAVACLGVSGILCEGCAPLGNDLTSSTSPSKQPQVAATNSGAANQKMLGQTPQPAAQKPDEKPAGKIAKKPVSKPAQKLAQKSAVKPALKPGAQISQTSAGRVRISDAGKTPAAEVASKTREARPGSQPKPTAGNPPTPETRDAKTELAADWVETLEPSADGKRASKGPQNVRPVAATKRVGKKSAAPAQDPFLPGRTIAAPADALSNDTLPDDAVAVATTTDVPRPPQDEDQKFVRQSRIVAENSAHANPAADRVPRGSGHERQRANVLMERAYAMYRSGYPDEALRLASVAAELEKSRQAVYRKGEERPSDFITWLQSADGGRSASPPVIRPQRSSGEQTADMSPSPPEAGITTTSVATQTKRPLGEILRADGDSILQSRPATARTNAGLEVLASETPRFPSRDNGDQRSTANSPQVAAPAPPTTRNPDAAVAASQTDGPGFDSLSVNDAPPPPADVPRIEPRSAAAGGPSLAASEEPVEKRAQTAATESESFTEAAAPGLIPLRTTQLTLIGIIGLLTGVAGMAGLSWWHVQERRHYAGK